jgi:hypothetical protein
LHLYFSETWNEDHILIVYTLEKDKKVEVKFTLEQAMKAQRGSRGIAPFFLNLSARWGRGCSTPRPGLFTPGKDPIPTV